jgi:pyruvate/2-oxoglutarate dehydrogenase complex dihydrolipoamide dehydrogenase (E3) component
MKNDYDLVIIGGSIAGYQAALEAVKLQAKVALVQPQTTYNFNYHYLFREVTKISQQYLEMATLGIIKHDQNREYNIQSNIINRPNQNNLLSINQSILYAQTIGANFNQINSVTNLISQGVDVIIGRGEFYTSPSLSFAVNDRILTACNYLLASGSSPQIPDIEGLEKTGYFTLQNIWQCLEKPNRPQNWVIIGGLPQSIEIAQTLAHFGFSITLILNHPSVLNYLDSEIANLLITVLEADGIKVFNKTTVSQVQKIENKKWVQAGDKAIETDEILVANAQQPNIDNLNLAAAGVKWYTRRLLVNKKLQTTNKKIYACGDVIGGYDITNLGNYEAKIAVKNALFLPTTPVNYGCIPWVIYSQPMVAQVGLTEKKAKNQYGEKEVLVFKNYFKSISAAQINNEMTGICKLIVLKNGKILGCSILGKAAEELINLIALAISENLQVENLEKLAVVNTSFSEILQQTARKWNEHKLSNNHLLQELLQSFFHFRRDWNF